MKEARHALFSKLAAAVFAVLMAIGMVTPAYADTPTGKITVTGFKEAATVSAYQVLENDSATGAWTLTDWAKTALGNDVGTALSALTTSSNSNTSTIATYLDKLATYATNAENSVTAVTASAAAPAEGSTSSAELPTTSLGSYLIVCSSTNYIYTNMLASNYDNSKTPVLQDASVVAKGAPKQVVEEKKATDEDVAIGDVVEYKVKVMVPDYRGTATTDVSPKLVITDIMGSVLELVQNADGTAITDDTDASSYISLAWTDSVTTSQNPNAMFTSVTKTSTGFTMTFNPAWLSANASAISNQEFTLTYYAKVKGLNTTGTENALKNTVKATVNVDGKTDTESETEEIVYTAAIKLTKYGVSTDGQKLTGAVFQLKKDETALYFTSNNGVFTLCDSTAFGASQDIDFGESDNVTIKGLDSDATYTLVETKAPAGYKKIADTTIKFVEDSTTEGTYTLTAKKGDETSAEVTGGTTAAAVVNANVIDSTLDALPSTGGMGMVVMTIAGAAAVAAFGSGIVALRKKSEK